jgi:hypothetical protein
LNWKLGIDLTKHVQQGQQGRTNTELFESSCGDGKMMQGCAKFSFQGKDIPCFIGTLPKVSITSQLLVDMPKHIDAHDLFDQSDGR